MTTQQTIVPKIILDTASKAITTLDVTKCVYFVVLPDGSIMDNSQGGIGFLAPKAAPKAPRTRRDLKLPYGTYTQAYKETVNNMKVGDVVCLPLTQQMKDAGATMWDLGGAVSAMAHKAFGKDAHKIHHNHEKGWLELLRVA
jgi:hypothetical protein